MRGLMDDRVSSAQENNVICEDTSSEESEDVKICDICGDVGEENKLALCSRCNDGAEHIYCMKVMIEEVPEGEWLCEDCHTEVQIEEEKKKLEKSHVKVGMLSFEKKVMAANVGNKELDETNQGSYTSSKRLEEDAGNVPSGCTYTVKEEDNGSGVGGCEAVNESTAGHGCEQTSNEGSNILNLKALDGEIQCLATHSNDVSCIAEVKDASNVAGGNKRSSTWSEFKSSAEAEDVKVCGICGDVGEEEKLVVCSRCNDGAEHIYCMRVMMEEVPEAEWLCEGCQTEVEIEMKRRKIEISEIKVCASGGHSSEGQMNKPVNTANSRSSSENDVHAGNVDSKELNKGNEERCMSTKRKEEDAGFNSLVRPNPLSRECSFKMNAKKGKDAPGQVPASLVFNTLKNQMPPLPVESQACKKTKMYTPSVDAGQLSKSSSFNNSKVPKVKQLVHEVPLKPKKLKDGSLYNAKKEAPRGILAKSASFKKPSSVAAPVPSKADFYSQHLHKGNKITDSNSSGIADGEGDRNSVGAQKNATQVSDAKLKLRDLQNLSTMRGRSVDSSSVLSNNMKDKKLIFSREGFPPSNGRIASTVPELDYIWKGGFELSTGRSLKLCEGLQAHLSCFASPKVLEVARMFPFKIQLEELPRENIWPPEFHENGPTCESIGLFFFAKDNQSYENQYSKLLENMLKHDLALRGNIGAAELLIFCSNILSKSFQRWNMFYFLWGVFRIRRKDVLSVPPDVPILQCSNLKEDILSDDPSTPIFTSGSENQNNGSQEHFECLLPLEVNHNGCSNGVKSSIHPLAAKSLEGRRCPMRASCQKNNCSSINDFPSASARKGQKYTYSENQERMLDSSDGRSGDVTFDVNTELNTCFDLLIHEKGKERKTIDVDNAEHLMDVDHLNTTVDAIPHFSGSTQKRNVEVANWTDNLNGRLEHKKSKSDDVGSVNS